MRRFLLPIVLLLLAAPAAAQGAVVKRAAAAKVIACERALDSASRFMVVEGRMRSIPGAAALRMRFDLQVRAPARPRWSAVEAPGFGRWVTADPAPGRWQYAKRVENLTAPAAYRMVVRYRWTDSDGRRIASARRRSKPCVQPDLRADLLPVKVTLAAAGDPAVRRYIVPLRNTGESAAGPFSITLAVGGQILKAQAPDGLAAGQTAEIEITGPRCQPGSVIEVLADADGAVEERDEDNNQLVRACP